MHEVADRRDTRALDDRVGSRTSSVERYGRDLEGRVEFARRGCLPGAISECLATAAEFARVEVLPGARHLIDEPNDHVRVGLQKPSHRDAELLPSSPAPGCLVLSGRRASWASLHRPARLQGGRVVVDRSLAFGVRRHHPRPTIFECPWDASRGALPTHPIG